MPSDPTDPPYMGAGGAAAQTGDGKQMNSLGLR